MFLQMFQFLGNIEVDQAKGIDVVKDGIRKLKVTLNFQVIHLCFQIFMLVMHKSQ